MPSPEDETRLMVVAVKEDGVARKASASSGYGVQKGDRIITVNGAATAKDIVDQILEPRIRVVFERYPRMFDLMVKKTGCKESLGLAMEFPDERKDKKESPLITRVEPSGLVPEWNEDCR